MIHEKFLVAPPDRRNEPPSVEEVERGLNESELFGMLGLRLKYEGERAILSVPRVASFHRGGTTGDSVNGGIQSLMIDAVVGCAAARRFPDMGPGSGVGRLEIRMQRPPRGDSVRAEAVVESVRRNLVYVGVRLLDAEDRVCTRATGTVFIRRAGRDALA